MPKVTLKTKYSGASQNLSFFSKFWSSVVGSEKVIANSDSLENLEDTSLETGWKAINKHLASHILKFEEDQCIRMVNDLNDGKVLKLGTILSECIGPPPPCSPKRNRTNTDNNELDENKASSEQDQQPTSFLHGTIQDLIVDRTSQPSTTDANFDQLRKECAEKRVTIGDSRMELQKSLYSWMESQTVSQPFSLTVKSDMDQFKCVDISLGHVTRLRTWYYPELKDAKLQIDEKHLSDRRLYMVNELYSTDKIVLQVAVDDRVQEHCIDLITPLAYGYNIVPLTADPLMPLLPRQETQDHMKKGTQSSPVKISPSVKQQMHAKKPATTATPRSPVLNIVQNQTFRSSVIAVALLSLYAYVLTVDDEVDIPVETVSASRVIATFILSLYCVSSSLRIIDCHQVSSPFLSKTVLSADTGSRGDTYPNVLAVDQILQSHAASTPIVLRTLAALASIMVWNFLPIVIDPTIILLTLILNALLHLVLPNLILAVGRTACQLSAFVQAILYQKVAGSSKLKLFSNAITSATTKANERRAMARGRSRSKGGGGGDSAH